MKKECQLLRPQQVGLKSLQSLQAGIVGNQAPPSLTVQCYMITREHQTPSVSQLVDRHDPLASFGIEQGKIALSRSVREETPAYITMVTQKGCQ